MAKIIMQSVKHINLFKHIALGFLGVLGSTIILILTIQHRAGMTPDSVVYISVARNLTDGNGFLTYNGSYLVLQPPLYPILLAIIKEITFIDSQISAGYVNAILFGIIIYISGLLLMKYLASFQFVILGTISVLISYAIVQASMMILSEPLFILIILLFLYYVDKFRSKQDYVSIILFSIFASLACLTRYTGIILILIGVIFILIQQKRNLKEKFFQLLIFITITVLPIGIWIIRNYFISGTPSGQRAESSYTLFDNIGFFFNTIFYWYLPSDSIVTYIILLSLLTAGWIILKLNFDMPSNFKMINKIVPGLLFVLFYSCIIVISSTTTAYDRISDRLLSPIYIPSIIIIFFALDKVYKWLAMYFNKYAVSILLTLCIISFLRFPLHNTLYIIEEFRSQSGSGYNSYLWSSSETIEYLLKNNLPNNSYTLYSNEPEAVYALTNLKIEYSPAKTFYNSPQLLNADQNKKYILADINNARLIWFNKTDRNFLYSIEELQKNFDLTEVASFDDGEIYTFNIEATTTKDSNQIKVVPFSSF